MRDLFRGDRGKEVLDVQTRLRGQGFELGREGVDGFFGPHTEIAVPLVPAGAAACSPTGASAPTPGASWSSPATRSATGCCTSASRRSAATTCSQLQVKLNLLGFNAGPERGVHDEEVERAVLDFQRNAGLPAGRHRRREHAHRSSRPCARPSPGARARRSPSATAATPPPAASPASR